MSIPGISGWRPRWSTAAWEPPLRSGRWGAHQPPEVSMKGILLWLIGVPIPIIILLYLIF
jgi:hypothetical protein